jgi:hypothetical protein
MPKGSFVIILPLDADYKVLGYYFKGSDPNFKITSDLFLRLNLDHSKDDYNLLNLKEQKIFSFLHRFSSKLNRKASSIIIGLLLNENDKPEKFRAPLKEGAEAIEVLGLEILEMSEEEFGQILKDIYLEHLEPLVDILKPESLRENILNITKFMLSGGKKERKIAQDLVKRVEVGDYKKISELYNSAEGARKTSDYEKAAKMYGKAYQLAEELYLLDIAESLKEKASFSTMIPELLKNRDKVVQEARSSLRNEDFHSAYLAYKKASDLSKKLVDFEKEEEYRLKSKALEDFYKIDLKYQKK